MKNRFDRINMRFVCTLLLVFASTSIYAKNNNQPENTFSVDTIEVYSGEMDRSIKNLVLLPEGYSDSSATSYPVLYLLHGYGGRYDTWFNSAKKEMALRDISVWDMIIVCPDGQNSWYWDCPLKSELQFETYISKELVQYIDEHYRTIASPDGRAVTGFSMGGHGGLWLGINHQDIFGACGSTCGGVDIRPFPDSWQMKDLLGTLQGNEETWDSYTVATQLDKIKEGALSIIIDCGAGDFFHQVNKNLHEDLLKRKVLHTYISRPGEHTQAYWRESLFDYQLPFFSKFFERHK